jgi:hypothetical protein
MSLKEIWSYSTCVLVSREDGLSRPEFSNPAGNWPGSCKTPGNGNPKNPILFISMNCFVKLRYFTCCA